MRLFEVTDSVNTDSEDYWEPAYAEEANIAEHVYPFLQAKIDKLNKRANKLNLPPIKLTIVDEFMDKTKDDYGEPINTKFYKVKVEGESPKLAGWEFVARVQHHGDENIIDVVPGEDVPEIKQFRATKGERCDHCKTSRFRVDTFIVKSDKGEFKQIGRNCLKDFLGLHKDPRAILWYMSVIKDLGQTIKDAESETERKGVRGRAYLPVQDVLASSVAATNAYGYIKRDDPYDRQSTVAQVRWAYFSKQLPNEDPKITEQRKVIANPTPKDYETAEQVLDWFKNLPEEQKQGEQFYANVNAMVKSGSVADRNFGYVVALYPMYMRAMQLFKQRERQAQKSNEWIGTVGQKLPATPVTIIGTQTLQSQFGTTQLIRMEDEKGNLLVWFNSGGKYDVQPDEKRTVRGTIKKHDEFKGRKQTILTRAKIA